jgi:hypothetical protein
MITENSTPRTQARAFSFFAFSGNVGIFLGPLIGESCSWSIGDHVLTISGGALSDPASQIGGIFKRIGFFSDYPYALPTFVAGTFGASAALLCGLFLKEVCPGIA